MEHRTLVKIMATKHCLVFRTISRKNKSPYAFYILRDSFEELEDLLDPSMTVNDIRSFAELRRNIPKKTVQIRFSWLSGSDDLLTGRAETVTIPFCPQERRRRTVEYPLHSGADRSQACVSQREEPPRGGKQPEDPP